MKSKIADFVIFHILLILTCGYGKIRYMVSPLLLAVMIFQYCYLNKLYFVNVLLFFAVVAFQNAVFLVYHVK